MPVEDVNSPKINPQKPPKKDDSDPTDNNPYLSEVRKIAAAQLAADALGIKKGDSNTSKASEEPGFGVQVVKSAIEQSTQMVKEANAMADRKDKAAEQARLEASNTQLKLFELMMTNMAALGDKLNTAIEKTSQGQPAPKGTAEAIKETVSLMSAIQEGFGGRQQPAPVMGMGDQMELQRMKNEHEKGMKMLDIQLKQLDTNLQLKLAELTDARTIRDREHEDSKEFKKNAITQISDAAASIAAGFSQRKPAMNIGAAPPPPQQQVEPMLQTFQCEQCQTPIAVSPEAVDAVCPGCNAYYKISAEVQQNVGVQEDAGHQWA